MSAPHEGCPACLNVATILATEGKHDPLYGDDRCCCRAKPDPSPSTGASSSPAEGMVT